METRELKTTEEELVRFLAQYEARLNRALSDDEPESDVDATADAFAEWFIEANPEGVACKANDEEFRSGIREAFEFHRKIGTRQMRIAELAVTELDRRHALAKVRWNSEYEKRDSKLVWVDFDIIYLFRMQASEPKIFGYITGDEDKILRPHGLVTDGAITA